MNRSKPIKIEIFSIDSQGKDHLVMQGKIGDEIVQFVFTFDNSSSIPVIYGDEAFSQFAKHNSDFEYSIYKLIQRSFRGDLLSFPINLSFE